MDFKKILDKIKNPQEKSLRIKIFSFFVAFVLAFLISFYSTSPSNFPINNVITIQSGDSLQEISVRLKNDNVIKSVFLFRTTVIVLGGERKIIAGDYLLDKKENVFSLAYRLMAGSFHLETVKITIPEGWNVFEMADYLSKKLVKFNKNQFLDLAKSDEGYLFPDTYFVSPVIKPQDLIALMKGNFDQKISSVKQIQSFSYPLKDVIIMASILEREALPADRRIVAGILWKRISIGMPLQVDSPFSYINGKTTHELTSVDLKIDSPYNTYVHKGLPPGPIGNPGVDAIIAAVTPVKTNYLYFLTEKDGTIHYAVTFSEHVANKEKYLR